MNDIIVIVGPTGIGKTKLSIELAKKLDAEIINGDSVQIYKGLDIGSAKIREEEMKARVEAMEAQMNEVVGVLNDISKKVSIYRRL